MTDVQKPIGLVGGMSWESSALYYRLLNEEAARRLGGHHNARSILYSVDYDDMLRWGTAGDWDAVADTLAEAARRLERAGAAIVLLAANSAHAVADRVQAAIGIPLLHIADPVAKAAKNAGIARIGLLGTRFTMEMDFLAGRLRGHGLDVRIPEAGDRDRLHEIIVGELTLGDVRAESRAFLGDLIDRLAGQDAQGVVVGCTELPLLTAGADFSLPAFDTATLHVQAALDFALA
ncbi:MAG: amino acid racemase [Sphingomonas sp.]